MIEVTLVAQEHKEEEERSKDGAPLIGSSWRMNR